MATTILVSVTDAADLLGVSERTIHELRRRPDFPKPVELGRRCVRWHLEELRAWATELPRQQILEEPSQLAQKRIGGMAVGSRIQPVSAETA